MIDTMGTEVLTEHHLKKLKENYSEKLSLDFNLYKQGQIQNFATYEESYVPKIIPKKPGPG
jgi:hypothetical protein